MAVRYTYDAAPMVSACMRGQQPELFNEHYSSPSSLPIFSEVIASHQPTVFSTTDIHLPETDRGIDGAVAIADPA